MALRRAFLWAPAERVSGAQCMVAWADVCLSKEEGGLGIRSLADQNCCFLVKFLHRLHAAPTVPWSRWVLSKMGVRPLSTAAVGVLAVNTGLLFAC